MMTPDYDKAATLAAVTLIKLGVKDLPVFPENLIRMCRNVRLMSYAEYCAMQEVAAVDPAALHRPHPEALTHLFEFPDGSRSWLTWYDIDMLRGDRWKFSLAHELGHIVLRHHGHSRAEELEANFFASHLLVPRALIAELMSRSLPLLEVTLRNLSNVSKACLWTLQQSRPATVLPEYNAILRQRMRPIVDANLATGAIWPTPHPSYNRVYTLNSYMKGYQE